RDACAQAAAARSRRWLRRSARCVRVRRAGRAPRPRTGCRYGFDCGYDKRLRLRQTAAVTTNGCGYDKRLRLRQTAAVTASAASMTRSPAIATPLLAAVVARRALEPDVHVIVVVREVPHQRIRRAAMRVLEQVLELVLVDAGVLRPPIQHP